jgi:hypothetical protein
LDGHVTMPPSVHRPGSSLRILSRWEERLLLAAAQMMAERLIWARTWGLLRAKDGVTYLGCDLHPEALRAFDAYSEADHPTRRLRL